jgi:hypothetical protein
MARNKPPANRVTGLAVIGLNLSLCLGSQVNQFYFTVYSYIYHDTKLCTYNTKIGVFGVYNWNGSK